MNASVVLGVDTLDADWYRGFKVAGGPDPSFDNLQMTSPSPRFVTMHR